MNRNRVPKNASANYERDRKRAYRAQKKARQGDVREAAVRAGAPPESLKVVGQVVGIVRDGVNRFVANRAGNPAVNPAQIAQVATHKVIDHLAVRNCADMAKKIHAVSFDKKGKQYKLETVQTNLTRVNNIYRGIFKKVSDCTDFTWTLDSGRVQSYIDQQFPNKKSSKSQYASLAAILRHLGPEFDAVKKLYSEKGTAQNMEVQGVRELNAMPANQRHLQAYNWPKILAAENIVKRKGTKRQQAIYSLYTQVPVRRAEFNRMKVVTADDVNDKGNFLVLDNRGNPIEIVLNDYKGKAADVHGTFKYDISRKPSAERVKLIAALKNYMGAAKIGPGDYFFPKSDGKHVSASAFSTEVSGLFKTALGVDGLGVNHLRHSWFSYAIPRAASVADKKKIAFESGTSVSEAEKYQYNDLKV